MKPKIGPSAPLEGQGHTKKMSVGILSLGCPRNLVDSEGIVGRLASKGYTIIDNISEADIGIINTCAFIDEARRESIDAILDLIELKKEGRLKKLIVYGCLPQRYKARLKKELPEIDAFLGRVSLNHEVNRFHITPDHYAYLKVCEGCVNGCSYCVIPKIKGRLASLDRESIVSKVKKFNAEMVSELNIIGQDITGYGIDLYGKPKLAPLLKEVLKNCPDIGWVRLLYLYPSRVSEDLLKIIRDSDKICKYIDLPIQHINGRLLKLMNRHTAKKQIPALIDRIRKAIPGVFLRTSVIVGFPSETDKEFKGLLSFLEEVKFERLGAFKYSREAGTPAYDFKGQLPQKVKTARLNAVMSLQQKVSAEVNRKFLGRTIEVLIDCKEKDFYLGRTQFDAPEVDGSVFVRAKNRLRPGDFVKVKVTDTLKYDLTGEAV